ncbi:MAG: aldolase/citrate lyase family protein [Dehalococcoidia bacterium]
MYDGKNLKTKIHNNTIVVGARIPWNADSKQIDELLSLDDYDFISIDSQHSPFDESQLSKICEYAHTIPIPVHLRIKHSKITYLIGNLLDLGPSMIEIPQTEEITTVKDAVDNFYYPSKGKRSWGGEFRVGVDDRHLVFPADLKVRSEYMNWWNNFGVLMLQVESIKAIENIKKFAVKGVDCVSWGPNDLEIDRQANKNHPLSESNEKALIFAINECNKVGIKLMVRNSKQDRKKYIDMGINIFLESPGA